MADKSIVNLTYAEDYSKIFEYSLISAKGSILMYLVMITLFYQIMYRNSKVTSTLFSDEFHATQLVTDAGVTALCAMVSVLYVCLSRQFGMWPTINSIAIVGLVLFLFDLVQESSGLNRWLAKGDIVKGIGTYAKLDGLSNATTAGSEALANINLKEDVGDPFYVSVTYVSMMILGYFVLFVVWKMIWSSVTGYNSGKHNAYDATYFNGALTPKTGFALELFIMMAVNAMGPLLSPMIKGEPYTTTTYYMAALFAVASLMLHIMCQYAGLYGG